MAQQQKRPPRLVSEQGSGITLEWERLTDTKLGGWRCFPCNDVMDIGEFVGSMILNGQIYKFHLSCIEQFANILTIFLQVSDGMETGEMVN